MVGCHRLNSLQAQFHWLAVALHHYFLAECALVYGTHGCESASGCSYRESLLTQVLDSWMRWMGPGPLGRNLINCLTCDLLDSKRSCRTAESPDNWKGQNGKDNHIVIPQTGQSSEVLLNFFGPLLGPFGPHTRFFWT